MIKKIAFAFALIAVCLLAYGYWHAETHATMYVSLTDVSERNRYETIRDAELSFMDARGRVLAKAKAEGPYGGVELTEPARYACREFERSHSGQAAADWQVCFERQSRWVAEWAPQVRSVMLRTGACLLNMPAGMVKHSDWWLWWVPLPHVGGTPYSSYSFSIAVDVENCAPDTGAATSFQAK